MLLSYTIEKNVYIERTSNSNFMFAGRMIMNIRRTIQQASKLTLLIGMAGVFSGNALAEKEKEKEKQNKGPTYATTDQLASEAGVRAAADTALGQRIDALPTQNTYQVGDLLNGGIVFWVDETGHHGLIAALQDQPLLPWYNGIIFETNAFGDGLYVGAKNTEVIVAAQSAVAVACRSNAEGTYVTKPNCDSEVSANPNYGQQQINAPQAALRYNVQADGVTTCTPGDTSQQCFGEWYLGSLYEMTLLTKASKAASLTAGVGNDYNLTTDRYWTSTEVDEWGVHSTRGYLAFTNIIYPPMEPADGQFCIDNPNDRDCREHPGSFAKEDKALSRPISRF